MSGTKALTTREERITSTKHLLRRMSNDIARALPKHVGIDRLIRTAITALTQTPRLAECSQQSFIGCLLTCAQLGLEPNTPLGEAFLIPRHMKNRATGRKEWTTTFQTGYKGDIALAYRSGMVTGVEADVVRAGDRFVWAKGLDRKLEHTYSDASDREEQAITHAWAVVRIRDAEPLFEVLPLVAIEKRRQSGGAGEKDAFSPWTTHYDEMAKKTALKAALKYAPKSAEMIRAQTLEAAGEGYAAIDDAMDEKLAESLQKNIQAAPSAPEAPREDTPARSKAASAAHAAVAKSKGRKSKPKAEEPPPPPPEEEDEGEEEPPPPPPPKDEPPTLVFTVVQIAEMMKAAEVGEAEAIELLEQGYEIDPNDGSVVPAVGGEG